jgi:hypothetical protein
MITLRGSNSRWTARAAKGFVAVATIIGVSGIVLAAGFEATDGNLIVDAQVDWESYLGTGRLRIGHDEASGQDDDSFRGKEDDIGPEVTFGSIPNNKSDLLRFYALHDRSGPVGAEDDLLYIGWVRANTLGTANMDFEFNQGSTLSANGVSLERVPGDLLVTFAFGSGGDTVELGLSRWTDTGPCEAASSAPCWGPFAPLTGIAEGSVNTGDVFDPIEGVTLAAHTFGEAMINLTAAGIFDRDECVSFGSAQIQSRASKSFK